MTIRKLAAAFVLAAAAVPAWAGDKEPVTLNDGVTAMAEVLETSPDSVKVRVTRKGATVETVIPAKRLDPVSFYEIRNRHMESTAENHVRLAFHCVDHGLLNQARFQMALARAIEPELDQKIKDRPDVVDAMAKRLAESAKRLVDRGEIDKAKEIAQILATRFCDTPSAARAAESLDAIEAKIAEREAGEAAARKKKVADEQDAARKAEAEKRESVVDGLEKSLAAARKTESAALRQSNSNNAKKGHEEAAEKFAKVLADVVASKAAADAELLAHLTPLETKVRTEYADALINAGNLELPRSNFDAAEAAGRKALNVAPGYSRATEFLESVEVAREEAQEFQNLLDARARRGGGRR